MKSNTLSFTVACLKGDQSTALQLVQDVDWTYFMFLLDRHRIAPQLHKSLQTISNAVPSSVRKDVFRLHRDNVVRTLHQTEIIREIYALLSANNIECMPIKGLTLGHWYPDLADRHNYDLDILIPDPSKWLAACKLLKQSEFSMNNGDPTSWSDRQVSRYIKFKKDITAQFNGFSSAALSPDHETAYVFIHGSYCGWFRIKWLVDAYAIVASHPIHWLDHTLDTSREGHWDRQFLLGLGALKSIFDLQTTPKIEDAFKADRNLASMLSTVMKNLEDTPHLLAKKLQPWERLKRSAQVARFKYLQQQGGRFKAQIIADAFYKPSSGGTETR